jgi:hypothetical protein
MPRRKQGKRAAAKSSASAGRTAGPAKKRRLSPHTAEATVRRTDETIKKPLTKAEQKRFKRFQKGARKAGLLVTRKAYELYFSDHLAERKRGKPQTDAGFASVATSPTSCSSGRRTVKQEPLPSSLSTVTLP